MTLREILRANRSYIKSKGKAKVQLVRYCEDGLTWTCTITISSPSVFDDYEKYLRDGMIDEAMIHNIMDVWEADVGLDGASFITLRVLAPKEAIK